MAVLVYRSVTSVVPQQGLLVSDFDGISILQEWNRGAERLTGFTKEEAVGKRLVQHFIADECHDFKSLELCLVRENCGLD